MSPPTPCCESTGIEVITIAGEELGEPWWSPCMTCPIERDPGEGTEM